MRNQPKTRRSTGASRKSSTRSSRSTRSSSKEQEKETRRGKKAPKKQDNTMLFVGIGVGAFVLLIIIIAAASGGGSAPANNNYTNNENNTQKPYVLPLNVRQEIYKRYMQGVDQFERERMQAMEQLSGDEIRQKGPLLQSEKQTKENNLRVKLSEEYRKRYPEAGGTFVNKIKNEGIDKNWPRK